MTVLDTNPDPKDWGDPKPPKRIVDRRAFAEFYATAHHCQMCWCHWSIRGVSVHHIVPRSQGGDDVPANFALLCGHGTAGCHGDVEARRNGARERLRAAMTPEQIAYVIQRKSQAWLDRHYPQADAAGQSGAHAQRSTAPSANRRSPLSDAPEHTPSPSSLQSPSESSGAPQPGRLPEKP